MKTKKIIAGIAVLAGNMLLVTAQDISDARQLIESERYHSAEQLLEQQVNGEGTAPEVNYLLVKSYLEQDKNREAGEYVEANLQTAAGLNANPINRVAYARYLLNTGDQAAATDIFLTLLTDKKNRKDPSLLLAMAEVVVDEKTGDAKAALDWLDLAQKKEDKNADIEIVRGKAWRKLGDASNAFLAYQNALKWDKKNIQARYLLGKLFTAQKNPDVYMEHFTKAYEIDSTYAPVLEELYNHYYYRDIPLAKKFLEKYIANSDYSLKYAYALTDIYYLNGEYAAAVRSAGQIIGQEGEKSQPRLYKLMAYSYAKDGDSLRARKALNSYFEKEAPVKLIAADFELRAQLNESLTGAEKETIAYYSIASEMDTVTANKARYASKIAGLYKALDDHSNQALWLGRVYQWKETTNNIDLFNWGLAHYTAKEYLQTDSVFALYSARYPEDIYGFYWRAQAGAAIDTSMTSGLAIPYYKKVAELGELNKEAHKKMLLKAYGYLGGYEANITKDYPVSLGWFEKYLEMDKENTVVAGYAEQLRSWIARNK